MSERIFVTTHRTWDLLDGKRPINAERVGVAPGRYELQRIPSPHGFKCNWLVLRATSIGMAEGAWRQWSDSSGDFRIDFEEGVKKLFWLSFCAVDRPAGKQFLGAAIVEAQTEKKAVDEATARAINPGGEVMIVEIPEGRNELARPYRNRLLQREEIERLWGPPVQYEELVEGQKDGRVAVACEECNPAKEGSSEQPKN